MSCARLGGLCGWLVACGAVETPERPTPSTFTVVTSQPAALTASAAPAAPVSSAIAPTPPPAESKAKPHRVTFAVKDGADPCTLVLTGELVDHAELWFFRGVTRVEAEACDTAESQLLFDGAQPGAGREEPLTKIPAIFWIKPGRTLSQQAASDFAAFSNGLQDLNADAHLDLCSVADGASARSDVCWLFDPKKRVFVYHPELSEIPHMRVSGGKLQGWTHARNVHESLEYAWVDGKAELVRRSTEFSGTTPDFTPTPGSSSVIVEELRAGKVVKKSQKTIPGEP